jgi:hypothetical protein
MNTVTEQAQTIDLGEIVEPTHHAMALPTQTAALAQAKPEAAPAGTAMLMRIIEAAALRPDMDLAKINGLIDVFERWEARDNERAYNVAFAAFKAESITILRNRKVTDGPLKGKSYAELNSWVEAVSGALSKHGLSSSWKVLEDAKDWIRVECRLKHVGGHFEAVSFSGPPDTGGAKNAMQARASTVSYLERYTLKAITGLSEEGDDTDANTPAARRAKADDDRNDSGTSAPPPPPPPAAKEGYTVAEFQAKLPEWSERISAKKTPADRLIAVIESKGRAFTEAQKQKLHDFEPPF